MKAELLKGTPQEQLITSCDDCIFQQKNNIYQVGCLAHDISDEQYKVQDNQSFKFTDKVCQYKRKKDWNGYNPRKMIHNLVKIARKEIKLDYCIVVNIDDIDDPIPYMISLNKLKAAPNKIILYLDRNYDKLSSLSNKLKESGIKNWQISQNLIPNSRPDIEDCIINYVSNKYFYLSDLDVHPRFFDWLDSQINDYGFGFLVIKGRHQLVPRIIYDTSTMSFKSIIENCRGWDFDELYDNFLKWNDWNQKERRFC